MRIVERYFLPQTEKCFIFCLLVVILCNCLSITYACGEISSPPSRIVIFPLFAEEILLDMITSERIVYVGHEYREHGEGYSPTMPLTASIPGNIWQNSNEDDILSCRPDLMILSDELEDDYLQDRLFPALSQANIPVLFIHEPATIQEIENTILLLGEAVHEPQKAAEMLAQMKAELNSITEAMQKIPMTARLHAVYYETWQMPFPLIAEICRLQSIYAGSSYVHLDDVLIADSNPDIIFFNATCLDTDGSIMTIDDGQYINGRINYLCMDSTLNQTSAVLNNRVYPIHLHTSQYVVDSIKEIIQYAYPNIVIDFNK